MADMAKRKRKKKKKLQVPADAGPASSPKKKEKLTFGRRLWNFVKDWGTVILIVLAIRAFGIESMIVPTGSMENTILPGDAVLVNKFVFGFKAPFTNANIFSGRMPRTGDIIVFRYPRHPRFPRPRERYAQIFPRWLPLLPIHIDRQERKLYWWAPENWVKRCVGVPGDTVRIVDKQLYVNGVRFAHDYKALHKDRNTIPAIVPAEEFQSRWMDLMCFMYADSLFYSDSTVYQSHPGFGKVRFTSIRSYYDSLFNTSYYAGRIDENVYFNYVMTVYLSSQYRQFLERSGAPLSLPLPPPESNDLLAYYNDFYAANGFNNLPPVDSFFYVSFILHYCMRDNFGPIVVPEGVVMGIGDNREESHDCRYWGYVPVEMLKGSPVVYYYSLGDERDASGNRRSIPARIIDTHWDRIGRVVK